MVDPADPSPESNRDADDLADLRVPDFRTLGLPDGLAGLSAVMDRLLAQDGCPWDREQTLDSLRHYLVEETYEVLESMNDPVAHRAELGDLLFQIVFQSALREREGAFNLEDVIAGIRDKMLRRHPHVFGARDGEGRPKVTASDVEAQWERIKVAERRESGDIPADQPAHPQPLASIPAALPALARARRMQQKAAALGFDWPDVQGALDKFHEEWGEFEEARAGDDPAALRDEFGDLLFVLVRLGQKLDLDAEDALRGANEKFVRRFDHVMRSGYEAGHPPGSVPLEQLEAWWQDAKRLERSAKGD
ncbi:MAG: nucleoside triphosphate pyrophosphohydrolase [Nannocystaceae bacterium]|nr:nucleoside triphosphate pyrophosphohydrolase [Nannocystaceae bacterium]